MGAHAAQMTMISLRAAVCLVITWLSEWSVVTLTVGALGLLPTVGEGEVPSDVFDMTPLSLPGGHQDPHRG